MVDYVTIMLLNLAAGLAIAGVFLIRGPHRRDNNNWAAAFGMVGTVSTVTGLHMALTWPLGHKYGWANVAYGETSLLLGIVFLGAAISLALGWKLWPIGIYALFAGGYAVLAGIRILVLSRIPLPGVAATGFVLAGLGGILALPVLLLPRQRWLHYLTAAMLLAASAVWAFTLGPSLWAHLGRFYIK